MRIITSAFYAAATLLLLRGQGLSVAAEIVGVTITPHVIAETMRYRRPRDPDLGAKVQLFVRGSALPGRFEGKTANEWLEAKDWAWHDLATAIPGTAESLTVWTFNGKKARWGAGHAFEVEAEGLPKTRVAIEPPKRWISNISFLAKDPRPEPSECVVYVLNASAESTKVSSATLWLPKTSKNWQTLYAAHDRPVQVTIPARERGVIHLSFAEPLPLTYAVIELKTNAGSLWEHIRIRRATFDISGGWIGDHLREIAYLQLLANLHVNCGQIQEVPGYTDHRERFSRYPMKLFNRLWPLEQWDTDSWLPMIHAVEFLGEPQFGGGRPVAPQEVF